MKPFMAFIQTRNWHLVHCVTVFLLICGGNSTQPLKLVIILPSVTGAVAIGLIIFCTVCIHRKWKKKVDIHPHGGGMNNNQSTNYIERLNSVYGQYHI
ncbi:uncharacterized protein LOC113640955 isoform X3 [Tachysurus fulvidraco]|uniref:uncharacterized protein LOC113640955 isoform X3 n=1 Tax=Tachysurus fulvidraco TaxID=1234273 RepID=UPI001FEF15F0|nr:uncharacterized protein LOC113640955 isoform X3 [Tachysurus fulvidraco]